MQGLYDWNVEFITKEEIRPGDIIFFADENENITHGGLFIEWIEFNKKFRYLHASAVDKEVKFDSWQIGKEEYNLHWKGFGRLKIID